MTERTYTALIVDDEDLARAVREIESSDAVAGPDM